MAKIYQRLLSKNTPRKTRQDSFHPQRVNLLGKDGMCMVNLLVILQKIVFSYYMIDLLQMFQKGNFVFPREHKNQNVATIGTLLDQFMLSCK